MSLVSTNDPLHPKMKKARVNMDVCLGCGVCIKACTRNVITLEEREQRVITPVDSVHRTVLMAIEAGKLPNLLFENQAMVSHRVMAAVLGGILQLPPVKQAMASEQMQSRYLVKLIDWGKKRVLN
jgi:ferredoxin